jgi:hypothetical protein
LSERAKNRGKMMQLLQWDVAGKHSGWHLCGFMHVPQNYAESMMCARRKQFILLTVSTYYENHEHRQFAPAEVCLTTFDIEHGTVC